MAAALEQRASLEPTRGRWPATADGSLGRALATSAGGARRGARGSRSGCSRTRQRPNDPRQRIEGAKDLLATSGAGARRRREQLASHLRAMESLLRDVEVLSTRADVRPPRI